VPAIGLVEAMQIVVARRVGERREAAAGAVFARTLLLVGVVSLALAALLRSGAGPLTTALLDSSAVAAAVEDFFRYGAWGIAVLSLNLAYSSLYVGLGRARILIAATLVLPSSTSS
jgi:Na+-driven multidrug efflux pump